MAGPNGVEFDGSTHLSRDGELTGVSDTTDVTVSFWLNTDDLPVFIGIIFADAGGLTFFIDLIDDGRVAFDAEGAFRAETSVINDGNWHHVCFSYDGTSLHLFVDDASDLNNSDNFGGVIDFTRPDWFVGDDPDTPFLAAYVGGIAQFALWVDSYLDISVEANRRELIAANAANSVEFGADGSTASLPAATVFFEGAAAGWENNLGTGGGFTENGTLVDATTDPPEYIIPPPSTSLDAVLQKQGNLLTTSLNALIAAERERIAAINAVLTALQSQTTDANAVLTALQSQAANASAFLGVRNTLTADVAAILQEARTLTAQLDAALQQVDITDTASVNALLVFRRTVTAAVDAALLSTPLRTAIASGLLQTTFGRAASINALLRTGFWQPDDEGNGTWRATPEGGGIWNKVPGTSTDWGNA